MGFMSSADTIFALATPPGKSGVSVLRLSGSHALAALKQLTRLTDITPRHAHFVSFHDPESKLIIDRGLGLYFQAPHSFTSEDVVELQLHGSLAVIRQMLGILGAMDGLRPAEPGEFTRRAFINGKMDLMEAEGLADLIDAETTEQKSQAMRQMQGELSVFYEDLRTRIIKSLAHLEAYIDFPDEEIPDAVLAQLEDEIVSLQTIIREGLHDNNRGERLRDGINVVILGAPNAGKSSLLNTLARRDAAIVSHKAGTTRDAIEIHMDICGYPVVLVDTAGLRDSDEDIEAEGIRRARARAEAADIKLVLFDGSKWPEMDEASRGLIDEKSITLVTKCDTAKHADTGELRISTKTGEGIEELLKTLEGRIVGFFGCGQAPFITRNRHRAQLIQAFDYLEKSKYQPALELKCEELRLAAQAVGKITGKIQVDDVLDVVFSSFCIGK